MKNKLYPCKKCNKEVKIRSKSLCTYCRYLEKGSLLKKYISKQTLKTRRKKKQKAEIMKPFWEYHLENVKNNPYCENCGVKIQGNICNIAHIIPKRSDVIIMDNLNNCIYLCSSFDGIDCHSKFDSIQSIPKVYLMPVWKIAVKRYFIFREECSKLSRYTENFENYIKEMKENDY